MIVGAALLFGGTVSFLRWITALAGLVGVVIVVGPGSDSFSIFSMLAVIGLLGFAGRDLASRAAPHTVSTSIVGFYGFLAMFVAGVLFAVWQQATFVLPAVKASFYLIGSVLVGVAAYAFLMEAMRIGEVSAVTPFGYSRLLFATALGVLLFGEQLTVQILFGSGLIVASGLCFIGINNSSAVEEQ